MRPSGSRSLLSALKSVLPVLIVVGFVVWALVRQRARGELDVEASTEAPEIEDTAEQDATEHPQPEDTADEASTDPPQSGPTRVRWEPPVRLTPVPPRPTGASDRVDQPTPGSRTRGRIEDLLERARNDDEGAA
jgi:hypothetical protein